MTARQANRRLVGDLRTVVRDAEELVKATAGHAGDTFSEVRSRLASAVESAKATYHNAGEKTANTAKATDRCIRDHPYQTIGVFFGLGILLGALVSRR
jgi:ElaB/YqjD/DUF883 family membrane-anchored ribosome-binding protein